MTTIVHKEFREKMNLDTDTQNRLNELVKKYALKGLSIKQETHSVSCEKCQQETIVNCEVREFFLEYRKKFE